MDSAKTGGDDNTKSLLYIFTNISIHILFTLDLLISYINPSINLRPLGQQALQVTMWAVDELDATSALVLVDETGSQQMEALSVWGWSTNRTGQMWLNVLRNADVKSSMELTP